MTPVQVPHEISWDGLVRKWIIDKIEVKKIFSKMMYKVKISASCQEILAYNLQTDADFHRRVFVWPVKTWNVLVGSARTLRFAMLE